MRQSAITWFPEGFPPPSKWYWIKVVWVNQPNVYLPTTAINLLHSDVLDDDWDYDFFKEVSVHRNIPTWLLNISGGKKKLKQKFLVLFFFIIIREEILHRETNSTHQIFPTTLHIFDCRIRLHEYSTGKVWAPSVYRGMISNQCLTYYNISSTPGEPSIFPIRDYLIFTTPLTGNKF